MLKNTPGFVGDGEIHPKAPTMLEVFTDPAKYSGTQYDPVTQPVPQQQLVTRRNAQNEVIQNGFIADHAEGDFWNPMHEPFHEDENNVYARTPASGGQAGLIWADFYRGAPKSALHWSRLQLRNANGGIDPGEAFMKEFISKLSPEQQAALK